MSDTAGQAKERLQAILFTSTISEDQTISNNFKEKCTTDAVEHSFKA